MPESGPYGSVRGALSNERPYRDRNCEADVRTTIDTARLKGANPFNVIVSPLA